MTTAIAICRSTCFGTKHPARYFLLDSRPRCLPCARLPQLTINAWPGAYLQIILLAFDRSDNHTSHAFDSIAICRVS